MITFIGTMSARANIRILNDGQKVYFCFYAKAASTFFNCLESDNMTYLAYFTVF